MYLNLCLGAWQHEVSDVCSGRGTVSRLRGGDSRGQVPTLGPCETRAQQPERLGVVQYDGMLQWGRSERHGQAGQESIPLHRHVTPAARVTAGAYVNSGSRDAGPDRPVSSKDVE